MFNLEPVGYLIDKTIWGLSKTTDYQQKLFLQEDGSRAKEWAAVCAEGPDGAPPVRVHRGAAARRIKANMDEMLCNEISQTNGDTNT